jgi:hypothetical protein
VAQETIKEDKGSNALVHLPRWHLRPSHLVSPRASALGMSSTTGASTSGVVPASGPSIDTTG